MQSSKPPHERVEGDHNDQRLAQERAAVAHSENGEIEADYRLIEARPFLQVLASIITRLYGDRSKEPPLTEQSNSEQANA